MTEDQKKIQTLTQQRDELLKLAKELDAFISDHASAIQRDQSDAAILAAAEDFRSDWYGGGWGASTEEQLDRFDRLIDLPMTDSHN